MWSLKAWCSAVGFSLKLSKFEKDLIGNVIVGSPLAQTHTDTWLPLSHEVGICQACAMRALSVWGLGIQVLLDRFPATLSRESFLLPVDSC